MKNNGKLNPYKIFAAALVLTTIVLGIWFPVLGFIVPIVMLVAVIVSLFKGRFHCGHICPRGLFLNLSLKFFSRKKKIPGLFKNIYFRIGMLIFMMGFLGFMISRNPGNIMHWGRVFWGMCVWTTVLGIILGLIYRPRIWCSFCPIGTLQKIIGNPGKKLELLSDNCKLCLKCEKECPLNLKIINTKDKSIIINKDCISCYVCSKNCPAGALDKSA